MGILRRKNAEKAGKSAKKAQSPATTPDVKNLDNMVDEAPASHTSSMREYLRRLVKDSTKPQTVIKTVKKGKK